MKPVYFDGQEARAGDLFQGGPSVGTCRLVEIDGDCGTVRNICTGEEWETHDITGDCREWDLLERGAAPVAEWIAKPEPVAVAVAGGGWQYDLFAGRADEPFNLA